MQQENHPAPVGQLSILPASQRVLEKLQGALVIRLANKGLVANIVGAVSEGNTIRALVKEDATMATTALTAEFEDCARSYTGCVNTSEMVFDECVEFLATQFGALNIGEVRHAFRLAAAGELGEVNLKAYHGVFTVAMLGEVLTAYMVYRGRIVAEVSRLESEIRQETRERPDLSGWEDERLEFLRNKEGLSADDCIVFDFEVFKDEVLELPKEEKELLWKDAYALALGDFQDRAGRGDYSARRVLQNPTGNQGFGEVRIAWYKRLLVVNWVKNSIVHQ